MVKSTSSYPQTTVHTLCRERHGYRTNNTCVVPKRVTTKREIWRYLGLKKNEKKLILVNKIEFYRIELNRFANLLILKDWLRGEDLNL